MKVKEVKGIICPGCERLILEDDVLAWVKAGIWYLCGECQQVYGDRDKAENCCKNS